MTGKWSIVQVTLISNCYKRAIYFQSNTLHILNKIDWFSYLRTFRISTKIMFYSAGYRFWVTRIQFFSKALKALSESQCNVLSIKDILGQNFQVPNIIRRTEWTTQNRLQIHNIHLNFLITKKIFLLSVFYYQSILYFHTRKKWF